MQLLLAVEEMQTQQRAENGIQEIIIGYVGEGPIEEAEELTNLVELGTAFMDSATVAESSMADLPDEIRSIVLAEKHRKETGIVLPSSHYEQRKDN